MKKIKEVYKPVIGYEKHYQVSNTGKVYSIKRRRFLNPTTDKYGYLYVNLSKDGKYKAAKVHRLVAEAFLGRKLEKSEDIHHLVAKDDNYFDHMIILPHSEHVKLHKLGSHHSEQTKEKIRKKHEEWWKNQKEQQEQQMMKVI